MSKPPVEVPQGAIRFNTDSQKMEFFAQDQWWEMATDVPNLGGNGCDTTDPTGNSPDQSLGARGVFAGSGPSPATTMDYINIASAGDAIDWGGELITATAYNMGVGGDGHKGILSVGGNPSLTDMNFISFTSTLNDSGIPASKFSSPLTLVS